MASKQREWSRIITVSGVAYRIQFTERPFRDGLEVEVFTDEGELLFHLGELGLGERATIEKVSALIAERAVTR